MLVVGFATGAFRANCYLLAAAADAPCVIIDPGDGAAERLPEVLAEHRLAPAAVLLTHGHADHVWDAAAVSAHYGLTVWSHSADRWLLDDPRSGVGAELATALPTGTAPSEYRTPDDLGALDAHIDGVLEIAGLAFSVTHTPGHTPGSVIFGLSSEEGGRIVLSGDTLFAGAVGRTDLPGGDGGLLRRSLAERVLTLATDTVVLPGHGQPTTIGRERAANPSLAGAANSTSDKDS